MGGNELEMVKHCLEMIEAEHHQHQQQVNRHLESLEAGDKSSAQESLDDLLSQTLSENFALFGPGGLGKASSSSFPETSENQMHSMESELPEALGAMLSMDSISEPDNPEDVGNEVNVLKRKLSMLTNGIKLLHTQIEQKSNQLIGRQAAMEPEKEWIDDREESQELPGRAGLEPESEAALPDSAQGSPTETAIPMPIKGLVQSPSACEDEGGELLRLQRSHADLKARMSAIEDENRRLVEESRATQSQDRPRVQQAAAQQKKMVVPIRGRGAAVTKPRSRPAQTPPAPGPPRNRVPPSSTPPVPGPVRQSSGRGSSNGRLTPRSPPAGGDAKQVSDAGKPRSNPGPSQTAPRVLPPKTKGAEASRSSDASTTPRPRYPPPPGHHYRSSSSNSNSGNPFNVESNLALADELDEPYLGRIGGRDGPCLGRLGGGVTPRQPLPPQRESPRQQQPPARTSCGSPMDSRPNRATFPAPRRAQSSSPPRGRGQASGAGSAGQYENTLPRGWQGFCLDAYRAREAAPLRRIAISIRLFDCSSSAGANAAITRPSRSSIEGLRIRAAVHWVSLTQGRQGDKVVIAGEDLVLFVLRLGAFSSVNGRRNAATITTMRVLKSVPFEGELERPDGAEVARSGIGLLRIACQSLACTQPGTVEAQAECSRSIAERQTSQRATSPSLAERQTSQQATSPGMYASYPGYQSPSTPIPCTPMGQR